MKSDFEHLRKAAILIATVDQETADELLGRMTAPEASLVRRALVDLQSIDNQELQRVVDELQERREKRMSSPASSSVQTVGDSPADNHAPADRDEPIATSKDCQAVFEGVGATQLTEILKEESPQVAAVVLSQLAASQASEVLTHLPDATQLAVMTRLAKLDQPPSDVLREVTKTLSARLQCNNVSATPSDGVRALARVLSATDSHERSKLIGRLARDDRDVALLLSRVNDVCDSNAQRSSTKPSVKKDCDAVAASYSFSDLVRFDNPSLRTLIRESDSEILALALSGANDEFVDRILGLIPFFHVRAFERRMQRLGPVRLRDIEQAQARLAELANELSGSGRILAPERMKHLNMAA